MTAALVIIPGICYLAASALYGFKGNGPLAIMYFGYAFANCGALWLDLTQK